jgi:hypothetical protein
MSIWLTLNYPLFKETFYISTLSEVVFRVNDGAKEEGHLELNAIDYGETLCLN